MTDLSNTNELLAEIEKAVSDLVNLFSSLDDNKINVVPYQGSWTAGQLLRHITKSTTATAAAMQMPSQPAERDAGKRINEIRTVFLDFDHTLQSPEFIVPEEGHYNKQTSLNELRDCFGQLRAHSNNTNVAELVSGLPLGEVTKLEVLHFVLYHTMRHLHQLKKICDALKSQE